MKYEKVRHFHLQEVAGPTMCNAWEVWQSVLAEDHRVQQATSSCICHLLSPVRSGTSEAEAMPTYAAAGPELPHMPVGRKTAAV